MNNPGRFSRLPATYLRRAGIGLVAATSVFLAGFDFVPVPEPRNPEPEVALHEATGMEAPQDEVTAEAVPLEMATSFGSAGADSALAEVTAAAAATLPSTLVAGRTAGRFAVTNSGAATYSIPLWTPPGIGNVGLQLALSYNSRGGSGVLGHGWSLSGLSNISRCNRTHAQDGAPAPVTHTAADRFCLDGRQLKLVSGAYGAAGSVYATEIESFSHIVANGTVGAGPASFTVTTRNGLVYEYGQSSDARIFAGTTGTIRTWALSSIHDRLPTPNRIQISYINEAQNGAYTNGTFRVASIAYPYTATGQGPFYQVDFAYSARPSNDVPAGYLAGHLVREPNKLDTISIKTVGSGALIKSYNLAHSQGVTTRRLRLDSVTECGAASCYRPTTFTYQNGNPTWGAVQVTNSNASTNMALVPIDLNSDGLTDILFPKSAGGGNSRWWAAIATLSGYNAAIDTGLSTPNTSKVIVGAFAGKGLAQPLLAIGGSWHVVSLNGTTFSGVSTGLTVGGEYTATDWDGDGLPDLVAINGNNVTVRRNTTVPPGAVSFAAPTTVWSANGTFETVGAGNATLTSLMDFNGDGRGDLRIITFDLPNNPTVNILYSNGFGAAPTVSSFTGWNRPRLVGDWNGDGCTDLVGITGIRLSDCRNGFVSIGTGPPATAGVEMLADQDGDGRIDYLYNETTTNTWWVIRSTGNGAAARVSTGLAATPNTAWFVFDQNGDGLVDLGYRDDGASGKIKYRLHDSTAAPADLASTFTDGFGMQQAPTYGSIARGNHTRYSDGAFPDVDWSGALYVVTQASASDGIGGTYQNSYWYYGAKVNLRGRGFEGFFAQRVHDSRDNSATFDYQGQQFPYTGIGYQRLIQRSDGVHWLTKWSGTLASQTFGTVPHQHRYFPFIEASTQLDYDVAVPTQVNRQTDHDFDYTDGFGNLTRDVQTVTDKAPASPFLNQSWVSETSTSFANTAGCSLPSLRTVSNTAPGQPLQTRTTAFTPNLGLCRIEQQTLEPDVQPLKVSTQLGYDSCGNVNSISVVGNRPGQALDARTTTLNYGTRCQVPESVTQSVTNAFSQTMSLGYRYDFVVPALYADPNQLATSWTYDDFGRRISETRPDGTSSTWEFVSCSPGSCWSDQDLRFAIYERDFGSDATNHGAVNRYFDGFERLRYSQSMHVNGVATYDETYVYDPLGRTVESRMPYAFASNGYTRWTYDVLGRPLSERLYQSNGALDRTSTWTYNGASSVFTDSLGHARTQVVDALGRLRSVTDPSPGGTTSYAYDSFGNLNYIRDPIGATSSGTYNVRGFRTQWADADRGTWNFTPNSLNETIAWTNAKNQAFTADYDHLGRLRYRLEPEGPSYFNYGTSIAERNVGRLESATGGGYGEYRTYDNLGRLKTRRISTDQNYDFDYGYNAIGEVDTLTYPAGPTNRFKVRYTYHWGEVTKIEDVSSPAAVELWRLESVNDSSLPTLETFNTTAPIQLTSSYKDWTNELQTRQAGPAGAPASRQNLSYTWDSAGRLQKREDLGQGLAETFSYDDLDRLTSSQVTGQPSVDYTYDASGNLLSKSDVGTYTYGLAAHPHAVQTITSPGKPTRYYWYDANGNQVIRDFQPVLPQTFASFDLPVLLQQTVNGSTYQTRFDYGPFHQRWKQVSTYANGTETTYYAGDGLLEKESASPTTTHWRHYVDTPSGRIVVTRDSQGAESKFFITSDHLGSSDVVLDGAGNVATRLSFTPWGGRRGGDWSSATAPDWAGISNTTRRGFTGHEHLDNLGLIHMNGRVYDSAIGRFLSVDPVIADLGNSQSVNPYAYVNNQPLVHTDPSGLCVDGCVAAILQVAGFLFESGQILAGFYSLVGLTDLPPPPATTLPGASAQNGVGMCGPGTFSFACSGGTAWGGTPGINPLGFAGPGPEAGVGGVSLSSPYTVVAVDVVISFIPVVGTAKGIYDAYIIVMDPEASEVDKIIAVIGVVPGGKLVKGGRMVFRISGKGGQSAAKSGDPRKLIPRQGPSEMSGSQVKRLTRDMQQRGFDSSKPIDVADVDGRQIILDGHHRARAAVKAGVRDVPLRVNPVTREQADQLLREAAEASLQR